MLGCLGRPALGRVVPLSSCLQYELQLPIVGATDNPSLMCARIRVSQISGLSLAAFSMSPYVNIVKTCASSPVLSI
eukprot:5932147-Amphidinium_carterae.1